MEALVAAAGAPAIFEAGGAEGLLGPHVPVERVQVDAPEGRVGEDEIDEQGNGLAAVAAAPVVAVADQHAELGFLRLAVDVVVHHVADVAPVEVLDGEGGAVDFGALELPEVLIAELLEGERGGAGGVERGEINVAPPGPVEVGVVGAFATQAHEFAVGDDVVINRRHAGRRPSVAPASGWSSPSSSSSAASSRM